VRKQAMFDGLISLETLDLRLSPTSLSLGASLVRPAFTNHMLSEDDPLPDPEPSPGPYPGDDPPITHPELPPSGPIGCANEYQLVSGNSAGCRLGVEALSRTREAPTGPGRIRTSGSFGLSIWLIRLRPDESRRSRRVSI
jgi:hypothetical protein